MTPLKNQLIRATNNWERYRRWTDSPTTVNLVLAAYPRVIGKSWIDYDLLTGFGEMIDTLNYCQIHGLVKVVFKEETKIVLTFKTKELTIAYEGLLTGIPKNYATERIGRSIHTNSGHWNRYYSFERIVGTYYSPVAKKYLVKGFTAGGLRAKIKTTRHLIEKELGGSIALFDMILETT